MLHPLVAAMAQTEAKTRFKDDYRRSDAFMDGAEWAINLAALATKDDSHRMAIQSKMKGTTK